jgi:hypothetical protein
MDIVLLNKKQRDKTGRLQNLDEPEDLPADSFFIQTSGNEFLEHEQCLHDSFPRGFDY